MLWQSRAKAWIWKGRSLVKKVGTDCIICIKNEKILINQKKGDLPKSRVDVISLPWTSVALDLLGPVLVSVMTHEQQECPHEGLATGGDVLCDGVCAAAGDARLKHASLSAAVVVLRVPQVPPQTCEK